MIRRLAVLVTAVLALASCSSGGDAGQSAKPSELNGNAGGKYLGAGLTPPQPRPNFTLTDTSGKKFSFSQRTEAHPTLLFFGFTNCPDICPTTMANINTALRDVPKKLAEQTYVVFVTTDVEHDTAPIIKQWLSNFTRGTDAKFVGLRGTQAQIDAAQAAAHVTVAEDGGRTHSAQTLLYGTDDYARVAFLQSTSQQKQIAHDLPVVAGT